MSEEVITPESVPEGVDVAPAEGNGADDARIELAKLNEVLGKDFKDIDTALKSVKDTYGYVGRQDEIRRGVKQVAEQTGKDEGAVLEALKTLMSEQPQEAAQPVTAPQGDFVSKDQYSEDMFFSKNAEYEDIKSIIKPIKNSSDEFKAMSWSDFVNTDQVKGIHETYSGFKELQGSKSVLESNPRLGAVSDKMTKAREAQANGDTYGARKSAVGAVLESLDA